MIKQYNKGDKIGACEFLNDEAYSYYSSGQRKRMSKFICNCGKEFITQLNKVKSGHTKSCGCFRIQNTRNIKTIHGATNTPEYNTWIKMRDRCGNPKSIVYHNYGGRGITVCTEWDLSFESFIKDVGKKPTPKHSLDRIENNKGYYKGNCAWKTNTEQCRNKRTNRVVLYNGEQKTLVEWSEILGMTYYVLNSRINKYKWSIDKTFTTPIKTRKVA